MLLTLREPRRAQGFPRCEQRSRLVTISTMTTARGAHTRGLEERRWVVHVWMIVVFVGSLVVLPTTTIGVHVLVGLGFAALVIAHLRQRRHRIRALAHQLWSRDAWRRPGGRLAWSDLIMTLLLLNVIVSGIADYLIGGRGLFINVGLPQDIRWHGLSAVVLLVALVIHVVRRWKRLRHSRVS